MFPRVQTAALWDSMAASLCTQGQVSKSLRSMARKAWVSTSIARVFKPLNIKKMPQNSKEEKIRGTGKKQNTGLCHKVCRASRRPGNLLNPLEKGCCREGSTQGKAKFVVNQGTRQGWRQQEARGAGSSVLLCQHHYGDSIFPCCHLHCSLSRQEEFLRQIQGATPSPAASHEVLTVHQLT